MSEFEYRPGLIFLCPKHPGLQFRIRDPLYNYNVPQGMQPTQLRPALWADFGESGGSALGAAFPVEAQPVMGVEGYLGSSERIDFRGGVFVLDEAADRLGWTDDERVLVAETMLREAARPGCDFQLFEPAPPSAPWRTYDETHHFAIPNIAEQTGTLAEALSYEQATKNREGVVKALLEKMQERQAEEALTAA